MSSLSKSNVLYFYAPTYRYKSVINRRNIKCLYSFIQAQPQEPSTHTGAYCEAFKKLQNMEKVTKLVSENKGVVIFSKSSCCMCYAVNILFRELGVNPTVYQIDLDPEDREMEKALLRPGSNKTSAPAVPTVFIDGKLVGTTNEVMSLHLSGLLVQLLKPHRVLA